MASCGGSLYIVKWKSRDVVMEMHELRAKYSQGRGTINKWSREFKIKNKAQGASIDRRQGS